MSWHKLNCSIPCCGQGSGSGSPGGGGITVLCSELTQLISSGDYLIAEILNGPACMVGIQVGLAPGSTGPPNFCTMWAGLCGSTFGLPVTTVPEYCVFDPNQCGSRLECGVGPQTYFWLENFGFYLVCCPNAPIVGGHLGAWPQCSIDIIGQEILFFDPSPFVLLIRFYCEPFGSPPLPPECCSGAPWGTVPFTMDVVYTQAPPP